MKAFISIGIVVIISFTGLVIIHDSNAELFINNNLTNYIENQKVIKFEDTPIAVQNSFLASKHNKDKIIEVQEIIVGEEKNYHIKIEKDSENWILKYDSEGTLLEEEKS